MSSISLTSSPMQCSLPLQHGQISVSGSTTISSRGRWMGRPPILRAGPPGGRSGMGWFVRCCRLRPGFDGKRRKVAEPERQLRRVRVALFRPRAEEHPFHGRQHRAQPIVLLAEVRDRRQQDVGVAGQWGCVGCHAASVQNGFGVSPGSTSGLMHLFSPPRRHARSASSPFRRTTCGVEPYSARPRRRAPRARRTRRSPGV